MISLTFKKYHHSHYQRRHAFKIGNINSV